MNPNCALRSSKELVAKRQQVKKEKESLKCTLSYYKVAINKTKMCWIKKGLRVWHLRKSSSGWNKSRRT